MTVWSRGIYYVCVCKKAGHLRFCFSLCLSLSHSLHLSITLSVCMSLSFIFALSLTLFPLLLPVSFSLAFYLFSPLFLSLSFPPSHPPSLFPRETKGTQSRLVPRSVCLAGRLFRMSYWRGRAAKTSRMSLWLRGGGCAEPCHDQEGFITRSDDDNGLRRK